MEDSYFKGIIIIFLVFFAVATFKFVTKYQPPKTEFEACVDFYRKQNARILERDGATVSDVQINFEYDVKSFCSLSK